MPTPEKSTETPSQADAAQKPEPLHVLRALADAGDLAGLLEALAKPAATVTGRQIAALVRLAVQQAGKKSPRHFSRAVYREAMAFLAYVQMRLHAYVVRRLGEADAGQQPQPPLSDELADTVLPQAERLMRLGAELAQSWATTARLWGLARHRDKAGAGRRHDGNDAYRQLVEMGVVHYPTGPADTD